MSWFETRPIDCPRCGASVEVATAETINVTRMPSARDRILDGGFHRAPCPGCGGAVRVERAFLYTDVRREQFVHVFPPGDVADWPRCEEVAGHAFEGAVDPSPPAMREAARRFAVRVVFGLDALAEKLRLFDAGLDDALVELQKLELAAGAPALRARPSLRLRVARVDPDADRIEVIASENEIDDDDRWALALGRHRELAAHRDELRERFPGLFLRPFVDYRRLARERPEGA